MRNAATNQQDQLSIADKVQASAAALSSRLCLESALMDATMFGDLAYAAFCQMGFEKKEPPELSEDESALVYWTISQITHYLGEAKAAFYSKDQPK